MRLPSNHCPRTLGRYIGNMDPPPGAIGPGCRYYAGYAANWSYRPYQEHLRLNIKNEYKAKKAKTHHFREFFETCGDIWSVCQYISIID